MSWESQSPSFYQHRLCVHQESTTPQRWCKDTTRCMLSDSVRALGETLKASRSFTSSWTWKSFYSTAPAPQRADSKVIERFICKRLWCNITPSAHVVSLDFTQSADLMWSLRSRASCGMRGACHLAQQRIRTEWAATRTPFSTEELNEFVTTMGEVDVDGTPFVLFIFQRNLKGRESSVKYEVLHRSSWSRDISIVDRPQQNHSFSTRNASNDLKDCRELAFHSWISGLLILGFQASTWSAENFRLRMQTKSFLVETGVHGTEETMRSSGRVPSLFQRRTTVLSFSSFVEARQWKAVMWEMIQNGTRFWRHCSIEQPHFPMSARHSRFGTSNWRFMDPFILRSRRETAATHEPQTCLAQCFHIACGIQLISLVTMHLGAFIRLAVPNTWRNHLLDVHLSSLRMDYLDEERYRVPFWNPHICLKNSDSQSLPSPLEHQHKSLVPHCFEHFRLESIVEDSFLVSECCRLVCLEQCDSKRESRGRSGYSVLSVEYLRVIQGSEVPWSFFVALPIMGIIDVFLQSWSDFALLHEAACLAGDSSLVMYRGDLFLWKHEIMQVIHHRCIEWLCSLHLNLGSSHPVERSSSIKTLNTVWIVPSRMLRQVFVLTKSVTQDWCEKYLWFYLDN